MSFLTFISRVKYPAIFCDAYITTLALNACPLNTPCTVQALIFLSPERSVELKFTSMMESKKSWLQAYIPQKPSDYVAFLFMIVMLWVIALFELFVVLPLYHEPFSSWWCLHVFCGFFFWLNVFANFFFLITTDTTGKNLGMPSVLKPGWTYCPFCQLNAPPRAHHCQVCNECVLKRDHHCIFAGKCVGFRNYRYYMFLALYLWLGAFYANAFHHEYVTSEIGSFSVATVLTMVTPILMWMLGYTTLYGFFISFMTGLSIFAFILFSGMLFFQIRIISRGQTSYERKKKKKEYDLGWKQNFLDVFGEKWYLAWIWPTVSSPLPGDGTNYKKTYLQESKDL